MKIKELLGTNQIQEGLFGLLKFAGEAAADELGPLLQAGKVVDSSGNKIYDAADAIKNGLIKDPQDPSQMISVSDHLANTINTPKMGFKNQQDAADWLSKNSDQVADKLKPSLLSRATDTVTGTASRNLGGVANVISKTGRAIGDTYLIMRGIFYLVFGYEFWKTFVSAWSDYSDKVKQAEQSGNSPEQIEQFKTQAAAALAAQIAQGLAAISVGRLFGIGKLAFTVFQSVEGRDALVRWITNTAPDGTPLGDPSISQQAAFAVFKLIGVPVKELADFVRKYVPGMGGNADNATSNTGYTYTGSNQLPQTNQQSAWPSWAGPEPISNPKPSYESRINEDLCQDSEGYVVYNPKR